MLTRNRLHLLAIPALALALLLAPAREATAQGTCGEIPDTVELLHVTTDADAQTMSYYVLIREQQRRITYHLSTIPGALRIQVFGPNSTLLTNIRVEEQTTTVTTPGGQTSFPTGAEPIFPSDMDDRARDVVIMSYIEKSGYRGVDVLERNKQSDPDNAAKYQFMIPLVEKAITDFIKPGLIPWITFDSCTTSDGHTESIVCRWGTIAACSQRDILICHYEWDPLKGAWVNVCVTDEICLCECQRL